MIEFGGSWWILLSEGMPIRILENPFPDEMYIPRPLLEIFVPNGVKADGIFDMISEEPIPHSAFPRLSLSWCPRRTFDLLKGEDGYQEYICGLRADDLGLCGS